MLEIYRSILNELTQKRIVSLRAIWAKNKDAQKVSDAMKTLCDMGYVKMVAGLKRCKLTMTKKIMKAFELRNEQTVFGNTALIAVGSSAYAVLSEAAGVNETKAYIAYVLENEGVELFDKVGNYRYAGKKLNEKALADFPQSVTRVFVLGCCGDEEFIETVKTLKKRFGKNVAAFIVEPNESDENKSEFLKIEEEAGALLYFSEANVSYAKLGLDIMDGMSESEKKSSDRRYRLTVGFWICEFLRAERSKFDRFSLFTHGAVYTGMSISDDPTEAVIESIACLLKSDELRISGTGSVISSTQAGEKKINHLYIKVSFGIEITGSEVEASLNRAATLMAVKENFVCEMNPCKSRAVSVLAVAS